MATFFCITIRFLQPYSHGRKDAGQPEWPPSPLRLFQALVAASAGRWNERTKLTTVASALDWLQAQPAPEIVAADATPSDLPYRLFVPDNVADKVATSWSKGRDASIGDYRVEKDVYPIHLLGDAVYYLYPLPNGQCPHSQLLTAAVRSITHLGWGIDMVVGDASVISGERAATLDGHRWQPTPAGSTQLRVPTQGTLDNLTKKHACFLNRLSRHGLRPVPTLKAFQLLSYRRDDEPLERPCRVFQLRTDEGFFYRYPQRQSIHIAGMVRHLAINAMTKSPPDGVPDDWVDTYVAGHARSGVREHRQFSYLPLPSIGHPHVDPAIRRIILAAPPGDDRLLRHVAMLLAGRQLEPTPETRIDHPPSLVRAQHDKVGRCYLRKSRAWATVTPVILPGHDDRKPAKTRKLIEKALAQSGIEQRCEFEWSPYSHFPKSLSAHKYDKDKRLTGYIRPDHLLSQTAVHLKLRFRDPVSGPLSVGAGRHCGLGLFAAVDE